MIAMLDRFLDSKAGLYLVDEILRDKRIAPLVLNSVGEYVDTLPNKRYYFYGIALLALKGHRLTNGSTRKSVLKAILNKEFRLHWLRGL